MIPPRLLLSSLLFAAASERSPAGLPIPSGLARMKLPNAGKLNRLLQELAWQAVTEHLLCGVNAEKYADIPHVNIKPHG